jgi:fermentation-respiration switch protein FrsA (DUF1100 family)
MSSSTHLAVDRHEVQVAHHKLPGTLSIPQKASALVIFAHGSGSSRLSPRNVQVAEALNQQGFATLLFDLLTPDEEDANNRAKVFDIALLTERLVDAVHWVDHSTVLQGEPIGLFGASTGAAAALAASAHLGSRIGAVVSRGGRPDMAKAALKKVQAPTMLIVGGADYGVIELNEEAYAQLRSRKEFVIVPGATHLFPERGALEQVIDHTARWFRTYLAVPIPGPAANRS